MAIWRHCRINAYSAFYCHSIELLSFLWTSPLMEFLLFKKKWNANNSPSFIYSIDISEKMWKPVVFQRTKLSIELLFGIVFQWYALHVTKERAVDQKLLLHAKAHVNCYHLAQWKCNSKILCVEFKLATLLMRNCFIKRYNKDHHTRFVIVN